MKTPKLLWTGAAVALIVVGFALDRTVLDGAPASTDDTTGANEPSDTDPDEDAADPADEDSPAADGESDDSILPDEADGRYDDTPSDTVDEQGPPPRYSDLPIITLDELPPEALDTLELIEAGGPYPYRQDDSTFQNREAILPAEDHGHYREYTVETPGSSDRGARRIVAGADGERYWADDHYDSFSEIHF